MPDRFHRLRSEFPALAMARRRIRWRGLLLMVGATWGWTIASQAAPSSQTTSSDVAAMNPPRSAASVYPQPDEKLAFKTTNSRQLFLHVFKPDPKKFPGPRPAIVFFHGGGWRTGDAAQFFDQSAHLARRGMVAISAEYRIATTDGTSPDKALEDAGSAFRFVRTHADELDINPEKIAAGGGSAGGQLAAALATVTGFDDPADDLAVSKRPAALVLFNPVIDNGPTGYGYERVAAFSSSFSPLQNVRKPHPPTILMLGTADAFIPVATGRAYCATVKKTGASCRLILFRDQEHGFFNRSKSEFYYRKTLEEMDKFLNLNHFFR